MYKDEHIVIIGASSGIGRALAHNLSTQGAILTLCARNEKALKDLQKELPTKSHVHALDITDTTNLESFFNKTSKRIDRLIVMAATYNPPTAIAELDTEKAAELIHINLTGVIQCTKFAINKLQTQHKGQISICSSVAGYVGLPNAQPYSATKAGLINFTETLKLEAPEHIDIKLINPGFVRTALTDKNNFDMPFIINTEKAAEYISKGLTSKSFEITFPKRFTLILKFIHLLPYRLQQAILKRLS